MRYARHHRRTSPVERGALLPPCVGAVPGAAWQPAPRPPLNKKSSATQHAYSFLGLNRAALITEFLVARCQCQCRQMRPPPPRGLRERPPPSRCSTRPSGSALLLRAALLISDSKPSVSHEEVDPPSVSHQVPSACQVDSPPHSVDGECNDKYYARGYGSVYHK
jgi:hypothetical protein